MTRETSAKSAISDTPVDPTWVRTEVPNIVVIRHEMHDGSPVYPAFRAVCSKAVRAESTVRCDHLTVESGDHERAELEWSQLHDDLLEAEDRQHPPFRRLLFGHLADRPSRRNLEGVVIGLAGLALGSAMIPVFWPAGLGVLVGSQVVAFRIYRTEARSGTQNDMPSGGDTRANPDS